MKIILWIASLSFPLCGEAIGVTEVAPVEDLMREHGILNRLLLIYEEIGKRMSKGDKCPSDILRQTAAIVHDFIEEYHEKLEEDYIFVRFEKAKKMQDLVQILREQHQKGRILTNYILSNANDQALRDPSVGQKIQDALGEFIKMYRPHEAREDTVLFPAFKTLVSPKEYDSLGDIFEDKEKELFGKDGFNTVVEKVAKLEKGLGIYNLSQFTPTVEKQM